MSTTNNAAQNNTFRWTCKAALVDYFYGLIACLCRI